MSKLARIGGTLAENQALVQVVAEAAALMLVTPWLIKLASNPELSARDRTIAGSVALATALVDGWLLYQNVKSPRRGR